MTDLPRIVILQNRSSGRGKAAESLRAISSQLEHAGFRVHTLVVGPDLPPAEIESAVLGAAALVLAGGDGTVHHALPLAIRTGVPIYQLPFGTENLFAREFGMTDAPSDLIGVLRSRSMGSVDVGLCNDRPFSLMCSIGFDANVVARLASERRGPTSRAQYVSHAIRELIDPRPNALTVAVNGRVLVSSQPGLLVVANSRHYAARFNPAPRADVRDGAFDIVFFPHTSAARLALWGARALRGVHTSSGDLVQVRGQTVSVTCEREAAFQLDGEHAGMVCPRAAGAYGLKIDMKPGALNVLSMASQSGAALQA